MSNIVDKVDVLIIGAGPAGLTAANCFNGSNGLRVRVIDKKSSTVQTGKADGLKSISLEVLDTFGIGDAVRNESQRVEEVVLWEPDGQGGVARSMTIPDRVPELGKPREMTLDQGRIEHHMASNLIRKGNVQISWETQPVDLQINHQLIADPLAYPVTVLVRSMANGNAHIETIHARYVVACDGARSWTRKHLNIPLTGDLTDSTWGVMDAVPKTNFPDIRKVCVVHSAKGTVMAVPREKKMVRFYIAMDGPDLDVAAALNESTLTVDHVVEAARSIFHPYTFEVGEVVWWSAYQVGQRVADEFSKEDRVFLAGDAVHTHSPKAGQGMNTSIQDAYNIGWKLRFHLEQRCSRSLLTTYEQERRPIAQQLINFDREYLELFANPNLEFEGFLAAYKTAMKFTTGIGIQYGPSLIVESPVLGKTGIVATALSPGMRLPDFQMVNQADGVPTTLYHRLFMNGQFRILIFAGDISKQQLFRQYLEFGEWLTRFSHKNEQIEAITIHSAKRTSIELMDLPEAFRPWNDEDGWDYWRVYTDDESYHDGHGKAYQRCGIDRDTGCVVLIRPDGYASLICKMEETSRITNFFEGLRSIDSGMIAHTARL
ncbi:FAD binding domain protein [Penicillium coprophilum]|uniref:FAD binding domain protein n=1 Tax=Penicillium coprophilum TaxID=36646 RepID=UPI00239B02DC|nr:FAD binding domain protein [Penicillium coprophilum]KAJ5173539.1 FAD binding domain protein [Penicillium coprophilum]